MTARVWAAAEAIESPHATLKERVKVGGVVTVAAQALKYGACLGSSAVLARLLTPDDYGIVAMATAAVGFAGIFSDLGLSVATVQARKMDGALLSSIYWLHLALGLLALSILAVFATPIASMFGDPRVAAPLVALGATLVFGNACAQHQALMKRRLRFVAVARNDTVAVLVGVAFAILSAALHAGYWSLVVQQVAQSLTGMLLTFATSGFRPVLLRRQSETRAIVRFGVRLTGLNTLTYAARNLDNALIGVSWGAAVLGIYGRAYALFMVPIYQINEPVSRVAIPALSQLVDSPDLYRRTYLRIMEKLALVTVPFIALLVVCADWVIELLLGPQWKEVARVFSILGVAGMAQIFTNSFGWLMISQGRSKEMLKLGAFNAPVAVLSFVAGLPWGAAGVATAYTICDLVVRAPIALWVVGRTGPVRRGDIARLVAPFAILSAAVLTSLVLLRWLVPSLGGAVGIVCACAVAIVASIAALSAHPRGRAVMSSALATAAEMARRVSVVRPAKR